MDDPFTSTFMIDDPPLTNVRNLTFCLHQSTLPHFIMYRVRITISIVTLMVMKNVEIAI